MGGARVNCHHRPHPFPALRVWPMPCQEDLVVQTLELPTMWDLLAKELDPGAEAHQRWATPGDLAKELDPNTVQTPALDLIDQAIMECLDEPDGRLIITMAPQEGKSQRVSKATPIYALLRDPDLSIVTASYAQSLANRNGRAVRNAIVANPQLGLTIAQDNGSVSEWSIQGHEGGLLSVGIGAGVTGRKADLMIIDDPVKDRKEADSALQRDNVWDWWTDAASSRLAPGASVILILTRWHQDDLAGRLIERDKEAGWRVINIPAQADHRPERGETDILGREPGEFMLSARGRDRRNWERRKATAGPRTWASLYQGRPSPEDGDVFPKAEDIARYDTPLWVPGRDGAQLVPGIGREDHELVQSWDLAFKDKDGSDYVVGQVWLRIGNRAYLLDQVRERMNFTATCAAIKRMTKKWPQAVAKFVEDKANGPAVINALEQQVLGIIPVNPEGSKYARASAVAPLVAAHNAVLPTVELLPGVADLLTEMADFPNSSHDDTVDALSQALNKLLLEPLLAGRSLDPLEEPDRTHEDDLDWSISPY